MQVVGTSSTVDDSPIYSPGQSCMMIFHLVIKSSLFSEIYTRPWFSRHSSFKWNAWNTRCSGTARTPGKGGKKGQIGDKGSQGMPGPRGDREREGPRGKSGPPGIKGIKDEPGLLGMNG